MPLLLESTAFGQPTRLDYGTGHELAFVLFLWLCVASGWVVSATEEQADDELVLLVFPKSALSSVKRATLSGRYLELVTKLQMTYRLEPAGSHGVWGLDDYCFFPCAAQALRPGIADSLPQIPLRLRPAPGVIDISLSSTPECSRPRSFPFQPVHICLSKSWCPRDPIPRHRPLHTLPPSGHPLQAGRLVCRALAPSVLPLANARLEETARGTAQDVPGRGGREASCRAGCVGWGLVVG